MEYTSLTSADNITLITTQGPSEAVNSTTSWLSEFDQPAIGGATMHVLSWILILYLIVVMLFCCVVFIRHNSSFPKKEEKTYALRITCCPNEKDN